MQKLLGILESKILPCPDGNDYVYGLNVANENIIYNIKYAFLEIEKEQIKNDFESGMAEGVGIELGDLDYDGEFINYYNETYNKNK